jgi:hypothetical protein
MTLQKEEVKSRKTCCADSSCCASTGEEDIKQEPYITGWINTGAGKIPQVAAVLTKKDKWEHFRVRMKIGRMKYKVAPGIYAVGTPSPASPVLVSANFKLSFDALRKELKGLDAWILVLDTKGINVWCAAGKGTFATEELVNRIESTELKKIVNHKKIILPQLAAPGVSAHKVKKRSGFTVIYGPIRASDIPPFLESDKKATAEMRRVRFPLPHRLALIPVELSEGFRYLVYISAAFFLLAGLHRGGYSLDLAGSVGIRAALNLLIVLIGGNVLGFTLLPWLPGRSFAVKGLFVGVILFVISFAAQLTGSGVLEPLAWLLMISALSSFVVLNMTGTSTYTSLSGVRKEMRIAVPAQISAAVPGSILWILSRFF